MSSWNTCLGVYGTICLSWPCVVLLWLYECPKLFVLGVLKYYEYRWFWCLAFLNLVFVSTRVWLYEFHKSCVLDVFVNYMPWCFRCHLLFLTLYLFLHFCGSMSVVNHVSLLPLCITYPDVFGVICFSWSRIFLLLCFACSNTLSTFVCCMHECVSYFEILCSAHFHVLMPYVTDKVRWTFTPLVTDKLKLFSCYF